MLVKNHAAIILFCSSEQLHVDQSQVSEFCSRSHENGPKPQRRNRIFLWLLFLPPYPVHWPIHLLLDLLHWGKHFSFCMCFRITESFFQVKKKYVPWSGKRALRTAVNFFRCLFWLAFILAYKHFVYPASLGEREDIVRKLDWWILAGMM